MRFLLWLSQQLDALGRNRRAALFGAIGLAVLAAAVFYVPALFESDSGLVAVRPPAGDTAGKPVAPAAPVADKPIESAAQPEPVKPITVAAPPAPPAPEPEAKTEPTPAPAAATAAPAPASTFQVQLGAFQDEARAERLAKRVTRAGFPATVTPVDLPDRGRFYRVRLKPELPHAQAKKLLARLEKKMPKQKAILVPSGA
ncbi:MAG: SPOR domain-containing protein [Sphingomonadaceae bacterium]